MSDSHVSVRMCFRAYVVRKQGQLDGQRESAIDAIEVRIAQEEEYVEWLQQQEFQEAMSSIQGRRHVFLLNRGTRLLVQLEDTSCCQTRCLLLLKQKARLLVQQKSMFSC